MDPRREELGIGCFQLCLRVADLATSESFYAALGFKVKEAGRADGFVVMRREDCEIGLFTDHVVGTVLNFRGGNTHEIARWLTDLGLELETNVTNKADGSGSVTVKDPDGHTLFFDSGPQEIQAYEEQRPLYRKLGVESGE